MKNYGFSELEKDLEKLRGKTEVSVIGSSALGRELFLLKIGSGRKKKLILASIHGREQVTSLFVMKSLSQLEKVPEDTSLFIVPMANPDGVEISLGRDVPLVMPKDFKPCLFKNNANNINLNANFPYCFEKVPKWRQGGEAPACEKETQAIISLCEKEKFSSCLSLHVRGNCIFFRDWGNAQVEHDFALAKSISHKCGFDLVAPTQKAEDYSGGFENWFRYRFCRPALCIELVKDEVIPYSEMCEDFFRAVNWDKTKNLFSTYLNFHKI